MSLATKHAILKEKYKELQQKYEALAKAHAALEHALEGSHQCVAPEPEQKQEDPSSNLKEVKQKKREAIKSHVQRLNDYSPDICVTKTRVSTLTTLLRSLQLDSLSDAHQKHLDKLRNSWQYRADFFCLYGKGTPGVLVVHLHSCLFLSPHLDSLVRINFTDVCGVAVAPWGVDNELSLHMYMKASQHEKKDPTAEDELEDDSYVVLDEPDPVQEAEFGDHFFWGFEDSTEACNFLVSQMSKSILDASTSNLHSLDDSDLAQEPVPVEREATGPLPKHKRRIVLELYELERYLTSLLGWSHTYLLPTDPPPVTDRSMEKSLDFRDVNAACPLEWEWTSDWDIDTGIIGIVEDVLKGSICERIGIETGDVVVSYRTHRHEREQRQPSAQTYRMFVKELKQSINQPVQLNLFRPFTRAWHSVFLSPEPRRNETGVMSLLLGIKFKHFASSSYLQGWQYAPHFQATSFSRLHQPHHFVRRRRWIREAVVELPIIGMNRMRDLIQHVILEPERLNVSYEFGNDASDGSEDEEVELREPLQSQELLLSAQPQSALVSGLVSQTLTAGHALGKQVTHQVGAVVTNTVSDYSKTIADRISEVLEDDKRPARPADPEQAKDPASQPAPTLDNQVDPESTPPSNLDLYQRDPFCSDEEDDEGMAAMLQLAAGGMPR